MPSLIRRNSIGPWPLLTRYIAPLRGQVAALLAFLLVSIALQLGAPLVLRRFIDEATDLASLRTLLILAGLYVGFAFLVQLIKLGETWVGQYVAWTATNALRADLALHVLKLDLSWHHERTPGELIERVDGDVFTLGNFFSRFIVNVVGNLLLAGGVIVILLSIDPRIGAVMAAIAIATLLTLIAFGRWNAPRFRRSREAMASLMGFMEERIAGTEDLRSAGATEYVMLRNHQQALRYAEAQSRAVFFSFLSFNAATFFSALGMIVSLAISAVLYRNGDITIGTVFLVFQFSQMLQQPIDEISRQLQDFQLASASVRRVEELQAARSSIVDGETAEIPVGTPGIAFDHVSFAYEPDEPVLRDVSFELAPGRILGIVGRTGSGKSTMIRLMNRFNDPGQGAVRIGGVDLRDVPIAQLRARMTLVTQEIQLFNATLRDNLTMFNASIPDTRIEKALDELGMGPWLRSLESGLETTLESGGSGVSAGEAQMLAFTRAFLRDPDIVILDEASSRLDPATEARLERAIDTLMAGRTGVIIAHRLATIERCDEVIVMSHGTVLEHGERSALAADPTSRFAEMLRAGTDFVDTTGRPS